MVKEIVLNNCYGGFGLSWKAVERLKELGHPLALSCQKYEGKHESYLYDIERDDPLLVQVVKELGNEANGTCAELKIKKYKIELEIENYDGYESGAGYVCYEWYKD